MERISVLENDEGYKAYPYSRLEKEGVLHDVINGQPVVFFTRKNTRSALDQRLISESRLIISAQAFRPVVSGKQLDFYMSLDDRILDRQTNSVWTITGHAVAGLFKGRRLPEVPTQTHFAFAWLVFRPDTEIFGN
jgi:hypothetical protein